MTRSSIQVPLTKRFPVQPLPNPDAPDSSDSDSVGMYNSEWFHELRQR